MRSITFNSYSSNIDNSTCDDIALKPSQFNEYLGKGENNYIIYNNLSGAMIEVQLYLYNLIKKNEIKSIPNKSAVSELIKGNFIVPFLENEIDRLYSIKTRRDGYITSLSMMIIPTFNCNFNCYYCYESKHNLGYMMSNYTMDQIINYVANTIKPTTKYFNVCWYGGEPLLSMSNIRYLSDSFIKISDDNNIKYFATMPTNGFLLNNKLLKELINYRVKYFQITIDGPPHIHDRNRILKNGKGTFCKIINNIKNAIQYDIKIIIRINIDKNNLFAIKELLQYLKDNNIIDYVEIIFGIISVYGNVCKYQNKNTLSQLDILNHLKNINANEIVNINRSIYRPIPESKGCTANAKYSMIVGPKGEIYKCPKVVGINSEICGHINKVDFNNANMKKWMKVDRLKIEQCAKCSMVPICGGDACPFEFIINKKKINSCNLEERHQNYIDFLHILYEREIIKSGQNI
jgi:uncharacterized protein